MIEFFSRLFGREPSGTTAKERLRLVLLSDHLALAPDVVEALRSDLIEVISRYVDIDPARCDVSFEQQDRAIAMMANVPVLAVKPRSSTPAPPSGPPAPPSPPRGTTAPAEPAEPAVPVGHTSGEPGIWDDAPVESGPLAELVAGESAAPEVAAPPVAPSAVVESEPNAMTSSIETTPANESTPSGSAPARRPRRRRRRKSGVAAVTAAAT